MANSQREKGSQWQGVGINLNECVYNVGHAILLIDSGINKLTIIN